ncbi:MAG: class I SAM-dependent methyltransferase [Anaerolineales bacterium]|nr:class I SAM-dependent methyltransferase [Anaerolineales bacterium]
MENLDLHGERAALRGNPSFVWRAGQNRRLDMILNWGKVPPGEKLASALVDGCGAGIYIKAMQPYVETIAGIDIEPEHLALAVRNVPSAALSVAAGEQLPLPTQTFNLVLSHEVLEHVQDDALAVAEMLRVLKVGGRAIIFVPNRLYPFETHGHYWRGRYYFGNTPLINYLPDVIRNKLAPHVRTYTAQGLLNLFIGQPVRVIHHTQIYPGYDNITARRPGLGKWLRRITYALENSPLTRFGLSHLLVVEKVA